MLKLELFPGLLTNLDPNLCGVYVGTKDDVHQELLENVKYLARHVYMGGAIRAFLNLTDPTLLCFNRVLLQIVKHHYHSILVKRMSNTLALLPPLLVRRREDESFAQEVRDSSEKLRLLVDLSVLCRNHVMYDVGVGDHEDRTEEIHHVDRILGIVERIIRLLFGRLVQEISHGVRDSWLVSANQRSNNFIMLGVLKSVT